MAPGIVRLQSSFPRPRVAISKVLIGFVVVIASFRSTGGTRSTLARLSSTPRNSKSIFQFFRCGANGTRIWNMGFFGSSRGKRAAAGREQDSTVYVNMEQHRIDVPVAIPATSSFTTNDDRYHHTPVQAEPWGMDLPVAAQQLPPPLPQKRGLRNELIFTDRNPVVLDVCPYCNTVHVPTRTVARPDIWTLGAVVLILIVFWPLFWVPLVLGMCKTVLHYCTSCGAQVGRVPAFQDFCVQETKV